MRWDQYSNVLQIAAALSLAGWVARTPDQSVDPFSFNNAGYTEGTQYQRYHPYSNLNHEFYQNNNQGPAVQYGMPANYPMQYDLLQSKEAEERFNSFMELEELVSWQEAYRRGDFSIQNTQHQVRPIINKENETPYSANQNTPLPLQYSPIIDDGYGSAEASVGSPSSSVNSGSSGQFEELSPAFSPGALSDVFDLDVSHQQGASGFTPTLEQNNEVDIDEILGYKNIVERKDSYIKEFTSGSVPGAPFSHFNKLDDDLDYVNSPLKSPAFNDFLASPMPGQDPHSTLHDRSFDDPFNMQFTNSSATNKQVSDSLLDFEDFDPVSFERILKQEEANDQEFVNTLSKASKLSGSSTPFIKQEYMPQDPFQQTFTDHDYQKNRPGQQLNDWLSKQANIGFNDYLGLDGNSNQLQSEQPGSIEPSSSNRRTFAPSCKAVKQQKKKSSLIWPDFPYTIDELVNMSVDMFNNVIKKLDDTRQHFAKDIRRKGKNKLAARTCRKRKTDVIDNLDEGIGNLEQVHKDLLEERQNIMKETQQISKRTEWLNNYIFEHLRDSNGTPYSSSDYSLQYTSDGNVYVVPARQRSPQKVKVEM